MGIVTVWANPSSSVQLMQLSDDPADGTPDEQIAHLATLEVFEGWQCVNTDFSGSVPDAESSLWRWSDGQIVAVPKVPASVTPRQVRLLLLQQGLLSQVEAMIAAGDEAAKITWEFASEFRRDDPLLLALSSQLGLTPQQVDGFFIAAAQI